MILRLGDGAIKIVYLYPDVIGGAEIFSYKLALELSKKGFEIHLIGKEGKLFKTMHYKNLHLHSIKSTGLISSIPFFIKKIIEINPDVIIAITLNSCLPVGFLNLIRHRPLIIYLAGGDIDILVNIRKTGILDKFIARLSMQICMNNAYFIALTREMVLFLKKLGVNVHNIRLIPNPIDKLYYLIRPNYKAKTFLYVGRIEDIKGVDVLIKAFSIVLKKHPDAKLIIVGNGSKMRYIKKLIKELKIDGAVELVGSVPYKRVKTFMEMSSVFVLPSRREGLSIALQQAMAAGLPIIATRVAGALDWIKHGKNGLLVPVDNVEMLAKSMEYMLQLSENELRRMGVCSRIKAQRFKSERIIEEYMRLIYTVCNER